MPTENDIPANLLVMFGRSAIILLLAAGFVGTIFGAWTGRGMTSRLQRVTEVTGAWSQGDFSEFILDPVDDEIGQLGMKLNEMAVQLQQFLKRSQELAISDERNRLARDLHDSAKQEALAASFHLGTALTLYDRNPESARKHVQEADALVDSVRRELTDLIHELRPPAMNGSRFDETINEYVIEWAHQAGIPATVYVEGYSELSLESKQTVYRILQEALANISRHSKAEKAEVRLSFMQYLVELCVEDNGIGFDPNKPAQGMGLESMRGRANDLNGEFVLRSNPGDGTTVCVQIPYE